MKCKCNTLIRPSVAQFACRMEQTLRKHDRTKGGQANWRRDHYGALMDRLRDELREVDREPDIQRKADELIDVANFCMMAVDLLRPLASDRGHATAVRRETRDRRAARGRVR